MRDTCACICLGRLVVELLAGDEWAYVNPCVLPLLSADELPLTVAAMRAEGRATERLILSEEEKVESSGK